MKKSNKSSKLNKSNKSNKSNNSYYKNKHQKEVSSHIKIGKMNSKFKRLFIKYSVLASILTFIVAKLYIKYIDDLISCLIDPFLSIDLNNDGKPDLKQLKNMVLQLKNIKIPIGLIIYNTIIFVINIYLLYIIVILIMKYIID